MDKDFDELFDEIFDDLENIMDELMPDDSVKFSSRRKTFDNIAFKPNIFKSKTLSSSNNYFQEALDDNLEDDYVINGIGSLDDDE